MAISNQLSYKRTIYMLKEKFEDDQNVVVGYAGYNVDMTV
jgi:hypothetical protein